MAEKKKKEGRGFLGTLTDIAQAPLLLSGDQAQPTRSDSGLLNTLSDIGDVVRVLSGEGDRVGAEGAKRAKQAAKQEQFNLLSKAANPFISNIVDDDERGFAEALNQFRPQAAGTFAQSANRRETKAVENFFKGTGKTAENIVKGADEGVSKRVALKDSVVKLLTDNPDASTNELLSAAKLDGIKGDNKSLKIQIKKLREQHRSAQPNILQKTFLGAKDKPASETLAPVEGEEDIRLRQQLSQGIEGLRSSIAVMNKDQRRQFSGIQKLAVSKDPKKRAAAARLLKEFSGRLGR